MLQETLFLLILTHTVELWTFTYIYQLDVIWLTFWIIARLLQTSPGYRLSNVPTYGITGESTSKTCRFYDMT